MTYSSDRSAESVKALSQRIASEAGGSAVGIQCDLREVSAPEKIVAETTRAFGPHIDILVNNAGAISDAKLGTVTPEHFDKIFHLNVRATLLMAQAVLPHLRRPGRIINLSSVGARAGLAGVGVYTSSKAAVEGLTRAWAAELGIDGTTVNAVNPGPVQSEMLEQVDPAMIEGQKSLTPVGKRVGTAQEIAEIVAFLAEERSSWVTGQCISASGGFAMY